MSCLLRLLRSYFFRDLMGPLLSLMGIAALVGTYESLVEVGGVSSCGVAISPHSCAVWYCSKGQVEWSTRQANCQLQVSPGFGSSVQQAACL